MGGEERKVLAAIHRSLTSHIRSLLALLSLDDWSLFDSTECTSTGLSLKINAWTQKERTGERIDKDWGVCIDGDTLEGYQSFFVFKKVTL